MIIDSLLMLSSAQNVTTGATQPSTNVIDLLNARDLGIGDDPSLTLAVYVTTTFSTTDSATLTVQFQGSTDNSTFTTYAESPAIAAASLVAGAKIAAFDWPLRNLEATGLPRYIRLNYNCSTLHFTPGAVSAFIVIDRQDQVAYPAGINIVN